MASKQQRLSAIFATINTRYADDDASRTRARASAKSIVNETSTIEDIADRYHAAQAARDAAMADLIGAIIAASDETSASHLASITGVNRKTIRAAIGKEKVY